MAESILKLSEIKQALKKEELNFKIQNSELNGTESSIAFVDACSNSRVRGKIVRSFNEGEVYHWPLLNHENVARLIDILHIRDDLYIYLTDDHQVTLKRIVHDENFIYDPRCFDRKRLYAKGIFSGLSYLHGKSLSLLNLCDDNIIISQITDTAIITNFDRLTCSNKVAKSKLNIPEMYMAPETEKDEFDAIKAEIWASGIMMLDMFLAHMVPWAMVDYKPKKVIQIVAKMSLELLQAANAGSLVSTMDLEKFKTFLKCFFKQNPLDRIPAKYAAIASFLQNRPQYKKFEDSDQSVPFIEDMLPLYYSTLKLPEDDLTISLNRSYDLSPNSTSLQATKREMTSAVITPDVSSLKTQQNEKTDKMSENKMEITIPLKRTSEINIKLESEENFTKFSSLPSCKTVYPITETEITSRVQKLPKSCEAIDECAKYITETSYNCYHSKSLSFIKPQISGDDSNTFQLLSKKNCCYSNSRLSSATQTLECDLQNNSIHLNPLENTNDNSVIEPDCISTEANKKLSETIEIRDMRNESQIKQRIPFNQEYGTVQTFKKCIVKQPKYSKVHRLLNGKPEIKSVIDKINFLSKCYLSIQVHQKIFISDEFRSRQQELIKEYQILLHQQNLQLREMLMEKYGLKVEDISNLIRCERFKALHNGKHYGNSPMVQDFCGIHDNRFLRMSDTGGAIKCDMDNVKYCPYSFKDMNTVSTKPVRNYSYDKAIENSGKNLDREWKISNQPDCKKSAKERKKTVFVRENKLNKRFVTATNQSDNTTEEKDMRVKANEMVKQHEQAKHLVVNVRGDKEDREAYSEKAKKKIHKSETKRGEIVAKENTEKNPKKPESNKKKVIKKTDKKEKKLNALKKQEEPKHSWFSSLCPGGRVEEPTPIADTLCETCKFNLEII